MPAFLATLGTEAEFDARRALFRSIAIGDEIHYLGRWIASEIGNLRVRRGKVEHRSGVMVRDRWAVAFVGWMKEKGQ